MTSIEAVKRNTAYSIFMREAKCAAHSYIVASPDTLTSELCAKEFLSALTGTDIDRVGELKDVFMLPFGDKVLIADADFITETAYVMPTRLDKKYFIVRAAETANESAQNKLLKTLEEPPEMAVIILLCANEYAMLPTVRSRCRIIRPDLYDNETLRSVLDTEFPTCENKSFVVTAANGNLSKLIEVAKNGVRHFEKALKILTFMRKSSEILPFAAELIAGKENLGEVLDALELILRDCMVYSYMPELINLKDNVKDISELSKSYDANVVIKELPVIARARRRIMTGGNVNSIVDELLFSLLEGKARCQRL